MGSMKRRAAKKRSMRRKKRVSKVGTGRMAKVMVFRGTKARTVGGLKKDNLTKNKYGRVVSKKRSAKGKKSGWMAACQKARKAMGIRDSKLSVERPPEVKLC